MQKLNWRGQKIVPLVLDFWLVSALRMRNAEVAKPITTQKLIAKTDLACVSVVSVCDCVNSVTAPKMAAPLAVAFLFVALLAPSKGQCVCVCVCVCGVSLRTNT